ncbi:endonuclease-8 [Marmoricola sp. OAE513]|uniref:Fpg/Nei family DNA glycosylase n=1 Tax=Marmoricola sp. OAE513 TaxID=2817894 RepID=UPI001AE446FD
MPEGDTVFHTARRLDPLVGQELTSTDFRIPSLATVDLSGRTVVESASRGKHLLLRLSGDVTIHSHLKMEGRWDLQKPGEKFRRPEFDIRALLRTEQHQAVGYAVLLDVVPTAEEHSLVGHLGPDLLGADWDPEVAVERLMRLPHVPIGEALLDQRNLAGIGNVYRAEICFLSGVAPRTPVSAVPNLPRMVTLAARLLDIHRDKASRVTTGDRRPGRRLWVYGRKGPCLRCGTTVLIDELGPEGQERTVWWCPYCQPPR